MHTTLMVAIQLFCAFLLAHNSKPSAIAGESMTYKVLRPSKGSISSCRAMAATNNNLLAAAGYVAAPGVAEHAVVIWKTDTDKELLYIPTDGEVYALALSVDGELLAIGEGSVDFPGKDRGAISIWSLRDRKRVNTLKGHKHWITALRFTPDGKQLISGSWDRTVRLWDMANAEEVAVLYECRIPDQLMRPDIHPDELGYHISGLAICPDGGLIAIADSTGSLTVYDVIQKKTIAVYTGSRRHKCLSFMPDGTRLASGSVSGLRMYDLATSEELYRLERAKDAVTSPDGKWLATAECVGEQDVIRLLDPLSGRPVFELEATVPFKDFLGKPKVLRGCTAPMVFVAGSGTFAACGRSDILVWDLSPKTGKARE